MRIDIKFIPKWDVARKSKGLKAKHVANIFPDASITDKILITTLEGNQKVSENSVICIGDFNDIWQQSVKKLLAKYDVVDIDENGWLICIPKSSGNNAVYCFEITQDFVDSLLSPDIHPNRQQDGNYYIIGQYGEKHDDGLRQSCIVGDFICQDLTNPDDTWVVMRKIFNNTYTITK